LTGLSDDDHTQYALADGSRGTFASPGSVTTVQTNLTTHQNLTDTAHGGIVNIPIGGSIDYFGGTEPADGKWKFPNNQELAIATYTTLYNLLTTTGTVFPYGANTNGAGGAGSSHFRLPDLRGRDTVMLSGASGVLTGTDTMGTVGGAQTVALTPAETPLRTHTHSGTTATQSAFHQHSGTTGNDNTDHSHSGTSGTVSSDHAHNITNSGGGATGAMAVPTGAININSAASGTLRVGGQGSVTMSGTMSGITANHTHTLTTGGRSAFHQHTITVGNELTNHTHTITTGNPSVAEANGTAHQNMQPHMRVYKLIRVL
jgi:microcystin-dependent protein